MREIKYQIYISELVRDGSHIFQVNSIAFDTSSNEIHVGIIDNKEIVEVITEKKNLRQFTGLKDKNGKEIYEGGVVRISHPPQYIQESELIGMVTFNNFGAYRIDNIKAVKWEGFSENIGPPEYIWFLNLGDKKIEIIGNIYENPKLLEKT